MSTADTQPEADTAPTCEACRSRPVYKPDATMRITATTSPQYGQQIPAKASTFCAVCLERCGNAEDACHRCPVCQPRREEIPPDTSIRDNECHCSIIQRCALCRRSGATTSAYDDGINPACGHLRKSKCDACGCCEFCVGCHCNED